MTSSIPVVNNAPLLDVRDLCVDFVNGSAVTHAVRGVSFQLGHEKLAIVGESGSGKSTVGRALLQLHPKKARVSASRMQFADLDLQHLSEAQMRGVRGKRCLLYTSYRIVRGGLFPRGRLLPCGRTPAAPRG